MRSRQTGFTLIELIMVIVILGVLSAVAIPKYVDLKSDANIAAAQSVAGSLGAASAINFAARTANSSKGLAVANCTDAAALLQAGALPTQGGTYAITSAAIANGNTGTCTLTFTPTGGAAITPAPTFVGMGIS